MKRSFLKKPIKVSVAVILPLVLTFIMMQGNAYAATPITRATHVRASSSTLSVPDSSHNTLQCRPPQYYSAQGPLPFGWSYNIQITQQICFDGSSYFVSAQAGTTEGATGWDEAIKLWNSHSSSPVAEDDSSGNGVALWANATICGSSYHLEVDSWFSGFPWITYVTVTTPAFSTC